MFLHPKNTFRGSIFLSHNSKSPPGLSALASVKTQALVAFLSIMLRRGYAFHVIRGLNLQGATFEAKKSTPDR